LAADSVDGWLPDETWNNLERAWHQNAKREQGRTSFTTPYIDADTEELVVTIARAVFDADGQDLGVVAQDVLINSLGNILEEHSSLPQQ
jgi:methyl-accepting chemotaxis protein